MSYTFPNHTREDDFIEVMDPVVPVPGLRRSELEKLDDELDAWRLENGISPWWRGRHDNEHGY